MSLAVPSAPGAAASESGRLFTGERDPARVAAAGGRSCCYPSRSGDYTASINVLADVTADTRIFRPAGISRSYE